MRVGTCLFVSWYWCVPLLWIKSFTPSCDDFKVTYHSGHHLWTSPSWCRATFLFLKLRRSQRIKRARQPFHHWQRRLIHFYVKARVLRFWRGAYCRMESDRRKSSCKLKAEVVSLRIVMLVDWLLTRWSWSKVSHFWDRSKADKCSAYQFDERYQVARNFSHCPRLKVIKFRIQVLLNQYASLKVGLKSSV